MENVNESNFNAIKAHFEDMNKRFLNKNIMYKTQQTELGAQFRHIQLNNTANLNKTH